jgi:hypothetical protein
MLPKRFTGLTVCTTLLAIMLLLPQATAQMFKVTVTTNKQTYNLGEQVVISGNLTLSGVPVANGQVAIQVDDPDGNPFVLRTSPTGPSVMPPFWVEILNVYPCDVYGNPKSGFGRGTLAYFTIVVRNNDDFSERTATLAINLYYPGNAPFEYSYLSTSLWPNTTKTIVMPSLPIPAEAPTGTAYVYANAFTALPRNDGYAYSPEKYNTFTIMVTEPASMASTGAEEKETQAQSTEGSYTLNFRMPPIYGMIGNYTIYVSSYYQGHYASDIATFEAVLLGDVNHDGKVDMKDIGVTVKAFGSTPGDPRWNPDADVTGDNLVDMKDVGKVVGDFGKTCVY